MSRQLNVTCAVLFKAERPLFIGRCHVGDAYDHVKHSCLKPNKEVTHTLSQNNPTIVAC